MFEHFVCHNIRQWDGGYSMMVGGEWSDHQLHSSPMSDYTHYNVYNYTLYTLYTCIIIHHRCRIIHIIRVNESTLPEQDRTPQLNELFGKHKFWFGTFDDHMLTTMQQQNLDLLSCFKNWQIAAAAAGKEAMRRKSDWYILASWHSWHPWWEEGEVNTDQKEDRRSNQKED